MMWTGRPSPCTKPSDPTWRGVSRAGAKRAVEALSNWECCSQWITVKLCGISMAASMARSHATRRSWNGGRSAHRSCQSKRYVREITPIRESDVTQAQLEGLGHGAISFFEFTSSMDTQDPRSGKPNKRRATATETISQTCPARFAAQGRISANQGSSGGAVAKCTLSLLEEAEMAPKTEQEGFDSPHKPAPLLLLLLLLLLLHGLSPIDAQTSQADDVARGNTTFISHLQRSHTRPHATEVDTHVAGKPQPNRPGPGPWWPRLAPGFKSLRASPFCMKTTDRIIWPG
ncbi:hypothetical protein B0T14DRAFT_135176 [Immersiella caudata]|uniref:Uncharacterized protein n=1 Tax=Immersiella caudata TaxID=314043 RepID=A0AA39X5V3_9PEZI|nr:hypothetical protein B0T14DRAFT_135176 [Immersiella caudata]